MENEKDPIKNISNNDNRAIMRTNIIIEYIKQHPYCTPYQISKKLKINYATTSQTIKELIFCNTIACKIEIGFNNRTQKRVYIPSKEKPTSEEIEDDTTKT